MRTPPTFPPGIRPADYIWHHSICPACGGDWWQGADPGDNLTVFDVAAIFALLGICGDCRDDPPAVLRRWSCQNGGDE